MDQQVFALTNSLVNVVDSTVQISLSLSGARRDRVHKSEVSDLPLADDQKTVYVNASGFKEPGPYRVHSLPNYPHCRLASRSGAFGRPMNISSLCTQSPDLRVCLQLKSCAIIIWVVGFELLAAFSRLLLGCSPSSTKQILSGAVAHSLHLRSLANFSCMIYQTCAYSVCMYSNVANHQP